MVRSAREIGSWFISNGLDDPTNTLDGNTKLQKLLFFSWLIHYFKFKESLFEDSFFAFPNGPVSEPIRSDYKHYYSSVVNTPIPECTVTEQESLRLTKEIFGHLDSKKLADLSHNSPAWKKYNAAFIKGQQRDKDARKPVIPRVNPEVDLKDELLMIRTVLYAHENKSRLGTE